MTQHIPMTLLTARSAVAEREVVEALRDIGEVLSILMSEFDDAIDRAAVRDAHQLLLDVALAHDEAGGYGVYPAFGTENETADISAQFVADDIEEARA